MRAARKGRQRVTGAATAVLSRRFTFSLTVKQPIAELSRFDHGVFIGLLIGEGSFGGDGKQPQVTLRMHVRHEALFRWLMERFPQTRLYGPYHHGGRSYYQWMARGKALVRDVLPLLEQAFSSVAIDDHAAGRFQLMCERYASFIARERSRLADEPLAGGEA